MSHLSWKHAGCLAFRCNTAPEQAQAAVLSHARRGSAAVEAHSYSLVRGAVFSSCRRRTSRPAKEYWIAVRKHAANTNLAQTRGALQTPQANSRAQRLGSRARNVRRNSSCDRRLVRALGARRDGWIAKYAHGWETARDPPTSSRYAAWPSSSSATSDVDFSVRMWVRFRSMVILHALWKLTLQHQLCLGRGAAAFDSCGKVVSTSINLHPACDQPGACAKL
jgi:hypothetical protein